MISRNPNYMISSELARSELVISFTQKYQLLLLSSIIIYYHLLSSVIIYYHLLSSIIIYYPMISYIFLECSCLEVSIIPPVVQPPLGLRERAKASQGEGEEDHARQLEPHHTSVVSGERWRSDGWIPLRPSIVASFNGPWTMCHVFLRF